MPTEPLKPPRAEECETCRGHGKVTRPVVMGGIYVCSEVADCPACTARKELGR